MTSPEPLQPPGRARLLPSVIMSIEFGRAPRGDPRVPHASEPFFKCLLAGFHGAYWIAWTRGRPFGVDIRPRKYDLCVLFQGR